LEKQLNEMAPAVASLAAKKVPPTAQAGLPAAPDAQAAPPAEPPAAAVDNMGTQSFILLEQRVGVLEKHFNEMAPAALPQL